MCHHTPWERMACSASACANKEITGRAAYGLTHNERASQVDSLNAWATSQRDKAGSCPSPGPKCHQRVRPRPVLSIHSPQREVIRIHSQTDVVICLFGVCNYHDKWERQILPPPAIDFQTLHLCSSQRRKKT